MRARTEALIGVTALTLLVAVAALLGSRRNTLDQEDRRPSVLLSGPYGARGLAEGLSRLGVEVERFQRPLRRLDPDALGTTPTALVLLDPSDPVAGDEVAQVRTWNEARPGNALVLAGRGAAAVMHCYGFTLDWRYLDSLALRPPAGSAGEGWPRVAGVLAAARDSVVIDSSRIADTGVASCTVPQWTRVDTLLRTRTGRVVALRAIRADRGGEIVVLADEGLARNRALRQTAAGPFMLRLLADRYRRVIFEEAHHGFGEGGSLARATFRWSRRSPLGWAMWQLALVGMLALAGNAVRFGPPRPALPRKRRSALEHVRALATALAAARGHDVAIGSMVQGLRRRLHAAGRAPRGSWQDWLNQLADQVRSRRARDAVQTLRTLTRPGQSHEGVLRAANAVEDVWEELHH